MKFDRQKIKFLVGLLLCTICIYLFSLLEITNKKVDYYNKNHKLITLNDRVIINEFFDITHENLDSLRFTIHVDEKNEKFKTYFKHDIENYDDYKRPIFPDINYDNNRKSILFNLKIDDKTYYKKIFVNDLETGYNDVNIVVGPLKNIKYKLMNLEVSTNNILRKDEIKIFINEGRKYTSTTTINDVEVEYELSCIMMCHALDIKFLIIFSFIVLYLFFSKTKKYEIFDKSIKEYKLFIIHLALSIVFSVSLLKFNINYSAYEIISRSYLLIMILSFVVLIKIILFSIEKYHDKLEKLFVIMSLFIGCMYIFTMIPNGIPDENHHYYEAEKLSQFKFNDDPEYYISEEFTRCDNVSKKYKCLNEFFFEIKLDSKKHYVRNTATAYSPVLYAPAAFGISIGRMLSDNIYIGYYIARLFNLLVTTIFGFFSIKILTKGKLIMFIYLLNPMYIHQGASISADVLTNAITLLFVSFMFSGKNKFSNKEKIILFTSILGFAIIKRPYIIMLLLLLLRIRKNDDTWKNKFSKLLIIFVTVLIIYVIVTNYNYNLYDKYSISSILRNPSDFILLFINTIKTNGMKYFETMFGSQLGWFEINISNILIYMYLSMLVGATLVEKVKLNYRQVLISLSTSLLTILSIFVGFLIIYSHRSEEVIFGVQGRYFIPVGILILFVMSHYFRKFNINIDRYKCIKIISITLLVIYLLIMFQISNYYM